MFCEVVLKEEKQEFVFFKHRWMTQSASIMYLHESQRASPCLFYETPTPSIASSTVRKLFEDSCVFKHWWILSSSTPWFTYFCFMSYLKTVSSEIHVARSIQTVKGKKEAHVIWRHLQTYMKMKPNKIAISHPKCLFSCDHLYSSSTCDRHFIANVIRSRMNGSSLLRANDRKYIQHLSQFLRIVLM